MACRSSQARDWTCATGSDNARFLTYWATRELPLSLIICDTHFIFSSHPILKYLVKSNPVICLLSLGLVALFSLCFIILEVSSMLIRFSVEIFATWGKGVFFQRVCLFLGFCCCCCFVSLFFLLPGVPYCFLALISQEEVSIWHKESPFKSQTCMRELAAIESTPSPDSHWKRELSFCCLHIPGGYFLEHLFTDRAGL